MSHIMHIFVFVLNVTAQLFIYIKIDLKAFIYSYFTEDKVKSDKIFIWAPLW